MLFFYCRNGIDDDLTGCRNSRCRRALCLDFLCSHLSEQLIYQTLCQLLSVKHDSAGAFASMTA